MPPLSSLFKRSAAPAQAQDTADDDPAVQNARTQARRRLIGAVALLGVGVVVFPLLFDSKPRPLPGDVRIALQDGTSPSGDAGQPRPKPVAVAPLPSAPGSAGAAATPVAAAPEMAPASAVTLAEATEGKPMGDGSPPAAASSPAAKPAAKAAVSPAAPAPKPAQTAAPAPKPTAVAATTPAAPGARTGTEVAGPADASHAGAAKATSPAASGPAGSARYVVQVGAYTDAVALREARQKVEKLGLKTYTQVIENDAGKRTRVRVGPFDTRAEAEAAGAKIKAAGLPAYLLSL